MNPWDEVDMSAEQTMEQTVLNKIRYVVNQKVSRYLLDSIEVDRYVEMVSGEIVYRVEGHVYGEQRSQVVEYPRGWWQAFKLRWFPKFLLTRFPVINTKIKVEFDTVFPDFDPPEQLGQIVVHSYRREL